jgi:hypothetical protein
MITRIQRERAKEISIKVHSILYSMKEYDLASLVYGIAFESGGCVRIYESAKSANKRNNYNLRKGYIGDHVMYYNLYTSLKTTVKRDTKYFFILKLLGESFISKDIAKEVLNKF